MKDWFNKLPEVLQPYSIQWVSFPDFMQDHTGYTSKEEGFESYKDELALMLDYDVRNQRSVYDE